MHPASKKKQVSFHPSVGKHPESAVSSGPAGAGAGAAPEPRAVSLCEKIALYKLLCETHQKALPIERVRVILPELLINIFKSLLKRKGCTSVDCYNSMLDSDSLPSALLACDFVAYILGGGYLATHEKFKKNRAEKEKDFVHDTLNDLITLLVGHEMYCMERKGSIINLEDLRKRCKDEIYTAFEKSGHSIERCDLNTELLDFCSPVREPSPITPTPVPLMSDAGAGSISSTGPRNELEDFLCKMICTEDAVGRAEFIPSTVLIHHFRLFLNEMCDVKTVDDYQTKLNLAWKSQDRSNLDSVAGKTTRDFFHFLSSKNAYAENEKDTVDHVVKLLGVHCIYQLYRAGGLTFELIRSSFCGYMSRPIQPDFPDPAALFNCLNGDKKDFTVTLITVNKGFTFIWFLSKNNSLDFVICKALKRYILRGCTKPVSGVLACSLSDFERNYVKPIYGRTSGPSSPLTLAGSGAGASDRPSVSAPLLSERMVSDSLPPKSHRSSVEPS